MDTVPKILACTFLLLLLIPVTAIISIFLPTYVDIFFYGGLILILFFGTFSAINGLNKTNRDLEDVIERSRALEKSKKR